MNKTNSRKRLAKVIGAVCVSTALVASLALFTDRAQSDAEYTAGTLDLSLAQEWVDDNAEAVEYFAPGDKLDLDYTLTNKGSLDAKVRETFVVTTTKPVTDEFEIYALADVEEDAVTGLWKAKDGKAPITVRSAVDYNGGTKITYEVPEHVIAGNNGTKTANLVLLFNHEATNEIEGTAVTVEYLAQAVQNDNTGALGDNTVWTDVKVITETFNIGGADRAVVPALNAN